nr:hypothetical protein CFP56_67091 [Quercus suber]
MGDGFGGLDQNDQVSHSTPEPHRVDTLIGGDEVQAVPEGGSGVDFPHVSNMETTKDREEFSQPINISNAPNHEVNDYDPNLFPYHTNLQDFENQIQEIDTELGKFDHQHFELNHKTVNIPHISAFLEKEVEISLNAREATVQDLTPHVNDSNNPPSSECMTLRKWKKLARDIPMQNDPLSLNTGVYSVKSGSRFLANEANLSISQANQHHHEDIWKRIRSLPIPNKVWNFLWRACRDAIPVKRNLQRRKILKDDICEHCRSAPETTYHALWECPKISEVWEAISGCEFRQVRSFSSLREVLDYGFSENKRVKLMAMVMGLFGTAGIKSE